MNIIGVGIDIIENRRIKQNENFINRILHEKEKNIYKNIADKKSKINFLASRWACKEAIFKATQTNVSYNRLNIIAQENGIKVEGINNCLIKISLSHEKKYCVACAFAYSV